MNVIMETRNYADVRKAPAFIVVWLAAIWLGSTSCDRQKEKSAPAQTQAAEIPAVFNKINSDRSGITFRNRVEENINNYFDVFAYVYNGGGVAVGDINNDGL